MGTPRTPRRPIPLIPVTVKVRNCLKCQRDFQSEGDRVCPRCNEENSKASARDQHDKSRGFHRGYGANHSGAN